MASGAIDLFTGRIVSVLENEASLLGGVPDEIDQIKQELLSIGSFLKDAEKKNGLTEGEKIWVKQVRNISYHVEDIIDEFAYHINSQRVGGQFSRVLHKIIFLPKNLWTRHQLATKLQKINTTIRAIPERNQRYGVQRVEGSSNSQNDQSWLQNLGESSVFTKEDDIVGMEDERKILMGWLMDGDPNLAVVSVVGMGGSGKTTLAAKTCTHDSVKRHFECYALITVSQTYVINDILRRLIKELYGSTKQAVSDDINTLTYTELVSKLVSYLETRKYLVVLDDVWDTKLLMEIKVVFQDSRKQSRIVVTTRKEEIASFHFGGRNYCQRLQPLSEEDSWSLFSLKAFWSYRNKSCPPEIEDFARELVARCQGLPLAIVALGGMMSSKTSRDEWRKVVENLNWELINNPVLEVVTKRILLLSFNDLPYRLKHCFLYCSIFPEDYYIQRKRLIRLWLAEGFVEKVNRVRPEDVAESYFLELISRSMLQVFERNGAGRPRMCMMHDLMREIALSMSEREKFFDVYDGKNAVEDCKARRLSVQSIDEALKSFRGMSKLCSLLVFVKDLTALSFPDKMPSGLKLVRVLDLEDMPIVKLPSELPCLFNIRYLNLKGTLIKELPKSLGRLRNLETLNIRDTQIEKLPSGIAKCKNLRHLIMYRYTGEGGGFRYFCGTEVPPDIYKLTKLQVMACIEAKGDIVKQIGNMTQLTRIGITNIREEDEMNLCASMQELKLLHYLCLMVTDEEEILKIEALSSPPPELKTLILVGKLEQVPGWVHSLQNLTHLYFHWSRLTEDLVPHIEALPCLGELCLVNAYAGKGFYFHRGFVKLKHLIFQNSPQVTEIVIEEGVMPDLQMLSITDLVELKALPHGIEYLKKLEGVYLSNASEELVRRIRGEGAVDSAKVKHIPEISHIYETENGRMVFEWL